MLMSRKVLMIVLVLVSMLAGSGLVLAQPVPPNSHATYASYPSPCSAVLVPNGSGQQLSACYSFGGNPCNATIIATLNDAAGNPVPGWPAARIWLDTAFGLVAWCPYNFPPGTWPGYVHIADMPTNAAGQTRFSNAYYGGGQSRPMGGDVTHVWTMDAAGTPFRLSGTAPGGPPGSNLDIYFNSPDIDANGVVNLVDVVIFAGDFFGPYMYRSDFYWDGNLNLSDLVWLAASMGATCP
jgi:hypothetical protein